MQGGKGGLALGGIATVGQLQLAPPFIGLAQAVLLLKEAIGLKRLAVLAGVIL